MFSTVSPQIFPCFQQFFPQCYPHYPIFSAFKCERSPSLFPSGSAGLHAFRAVVFFLFCTGCPQVFPHCPQVFHKFSPFIAKPGDVQRLRAFFYPQSVIRAIELILGILACDAIHRKPHVLLISAHRVIRPLAVNAVGGAGHNSYTPRR